MKPWTSKPASEELSTAPILVLGVPAIRIDFSTPDFGSES
jgi:hypothetical protein